MPPGGRRFRHALPLALAGFAVFVDVPVAVAMPHPFVPAEAPEVLGLTADPAVVSVASGPATVAVSAHVAHPDGVAAVSLRAGAADPLPLALTSGYAVDGLWTGVLTVPAGTPHGSLPLAVETVGESAATAVVRVRSLVVADAAPAAPERISATAAADGVHVMWDTPPANGGSPVSSWVVTAAPASGGEPVRSVLDADARATTLTGLADGERYVVRVAASNAAGDGAPAVADATTAPGVTVPDAPTSVRAVAGDRSLALSWRIPVSAGGTAVTSYEVRAVPRVGGVPVPPVVTTIAAATSADLTGLRNGVPYDVAVVAVNAVGSSLSGVATATPRTVPGAPVVTRVTPDDARVVVTWDASDDDGGAAVESFEVRAGDAVVTVPGDARRAVLTRLPNGVGVSIAVTALNDAGVSAAAVSPAVTPRRSGRVVVVHPASRRVVHGRRTRLVAAVCDARGRPVAGSTVQLLAKVVPSDSWQVVASAPTNASGRVLLSAVLRANAALRLRQVAGAVASPGLSLKPVAVAPRVTTAVGDTRVRVGQRVTLRGTVFPAHATGSSVLVQRYVRGAWRTLGSGRMTTSTTYRASFGTASPSRYLMRVVKAGHTDHVAGVGPTWRQYVDPESATDIARDVRDDRSITLENTHDSGVHDRATAKQNVIDLADGRLAARSAYQNAPGGLTTLDRRLLLALRRMGRNGSVTVSELAGGSHSRRSAHYPGRGLDISWVNGRHVSPGSDYGMAVRACRAYGASRIFHPRYDPVGGHSHHVHCEWS